MPDSPAPTISTSTCSLVMVTSPAGWSGNSACRYCHQLVRCGGKMQPAIESPGSPRWPLIFDTYRRHSGARASASEPGISRFRVRADARPGMTVLSIPVMIRLERAFRLDADILGLIGPQRGQLDADLGEVQARDLLVERLRQHMDLLLVLAALVVGEQFDLRQRLVGERG